MGQAMALSFQASLKWIARSNAVERHLLLLKVWDSGALSLLYAYIAYDQ